MKGVGPDLKEVRIKNQSANQFRLHIRECSNFSDVFFSPEAVVGAQKISIIRFKALFVRGKISPKKKILLRGQIFFFFTHVHLVVSEGGLESNRKHLFRHFSGPKPTLRKRQLSPLRETFFRPLRVWPKAVRKPSGTLAADTHSESSSSFAPPPLLSCRTPHNPPIDRCGSASARRRR